MFREGWWVGVVSMESGVGQESRARSRGWCPRHWLLLRSAWEAHSFPQSWLPPPYPLQPYCVSHPSLDLGIQRGTQMMGPCICRSHMSVGEKDNNSIIVPSVPGEFTEAQ